MNDNLEHPKAVLSFQTQSMALNCEGLSTQYNDMQQRATEYVDSAVQQQRKADDTMSYLSNELAKTQQERDSAIHINVISSGETQHANHACEAATAALLESSENRQQFRTQTMSHKSRWHVEKQQLPQTAQDMTKQAHIAN